jgi:hypothetical protein
MPPQTDFEQQLHRTWVQYLLDNGYKDIAAIAIDVELGFSTDENGLTPEVNVDIPVAFYETAMQNAHIREVMEKSLESLCYGRLYYWDGDNQAPPNFLFRIKLLEVEKGWQNITRSLIANSEHPNQAVITEKVFLRNKKEPYIYNEMKFASQAEIRIAQEFEARRILFFPLPLAVRAESGTFYEDHREVDFLICNNGTWGILEVSYHPDRFEKDAEKDTWFKKSGILCIQHYSAERCYKNAAEVVAEFLTILNQHRRS